MLEDTYGHSSARRAFDLADVYGIAFDEERSGRKKIHLAFIGAGGVVQSKHLPAVWRLRTQWEPVEIVAVAEPNKQSGEKVASLYGCRLYSDIRTLLAEEQLDAVVVASPDGMHYEHTMACLEQGLPVLVEKPIARSLVHAEEMCRLADERGVLLMIVSNKRYSPPYRRAKHFILQGPVKDPALCVAKFNLGYDYVWLLEQGTIHIFDLARFLMGDVGSLYAAGVDKYGRNKLGYPVDNVAITLKFTSGSVGNIYTSASALSFKPWERVEVYADKSWLAVEDQYELILYDDEVGPAKHWKPAIPNTLMFDEEFGGFMGMIENFLQAVRGNEAALATGWDGYHAYELNVTTHLSLSRGEPVSLPLDPATADREMRAWLENR